MRGGQILVLWFGALTLGASCGSSAWTEIVMPQDLSEASTQPQIASVRDLGGVDVSIDGVLHTDRPSDGIATIGEALWILGTNFGRQPTVQIGKRPAAVLSRTANEGILVRVPTGTPSGLQPLVVSNERGAAEKVITVRRYVVGLAPKPGTVAWGEVTADGPVALNFTDIFEARFLRLSADGRAAYVLGGPGAVLTIFELPAPTQPLMVGRQDLGAPLVLGLVAATTAHVLAVVRQDDVIVFDISSPLRPIRRPSRDLPPSLRKARPGRVEMSPDGALLAFTTAVRNEIFVVDVAQLGAAGDRAVLATLALEPDVRAAVLNDIAFSPDGRTLWVVSGDNAESRSIGPQPTRAYALRVNRDRAGLRLDLARTVTIDSAVAPVRVSTGRTMPLASGATIRLPPEKATVYITAGARQGDRTVVLSLGADEVAVEAVVSEGKNRTGGVDVSPDGRWLMAATVGGDGSFRVAAAPADGRPGTRRSISLKDAPQGGGGELPEGARGEIRVQP